MFRSGFNNRRQVDFRQFSARRCGFRLDDRPLRRPEARLPARQPVQRRRIQYAPSAPAGEVYDAASSARALPARSPEQPALRGFALWLPAEPDVYHRYDGDYVRGAAAARRALCLFRYLRPLSWRISRGSAFCCWLLTTVAAVFFTRLAAFAVLGTTIAGSRGYRDYPGCRRRSLRIAAVVGARFTTILLTLGFLFRFFLNLNFCRV
ncbi:Uncharacterised protein [Klebsiella michiganensis]|uniref:Uncharacterized protein n=1 Tax=Klebsiella michiganensis TaxID=1134687 RepID=A0A7H4N1I5_9ENTR|nr:Uncharacterised protein [Klebsiella michiganensis]